MWSACTTRSVVVPDLDSPYWRGTRGSLRRNCPRERRFACPVISMYLPRSRDCCLRRGYDPSGFSPTRSIEPVSPIPRTYLNASFLPQCTVVPARKQLSVADVASLTATLRSNRLFCQLSCSAWEANLSPCEAFRQSRQCECTKQKPKVAQRDIVET